MRINEVAKEVNLSKRAVKYYEEQGLLKIEKDSNGYRNYTDENITTLKEISIYRKLGIRIADIKGLLNSDDKHLLKEIYEEKSNALDSDKKELEALHAFIQDHDVEAAYPAINYASIGQAMQDMIPGFYGYYFMNHFKPYLQIKITSEEQQKAYRNIIDFWDTTTIKIPLFMRLVSFISYRFMPKASMAQMTRQMDAQIQKYLSPTEEEYEKLKNQTASTVRLKNSLLLRWHPAYISQRKFMKRLQDQGYNDIFIPNMIALSPKYKEYHEALTRINDRICKDLGLYYDSGYRLVMKKK